MTNIYICEDNKLEAEMLQLLIDETVNQEKLEPKTVRIFEDPYVLLDEIKNEKEDHTFFLDVDLKKDMNGLELAQNIRELFPRCYIIFTTSHSEMSYMTFTYKVEAMDYIIKGDVREMKNRVLQCMIRIQELEERKKHTQKQTFSLKLGSRVQEIAYDEILCFEVSETPHKLILHGKTMEVEFNGKIKEIENSMPNQFCRCHRSVIVNKDYIEKVDYKESKVVLKNESVYPLSVRMGKQLKRFV